MTTAIIFFENVKIVISLIHSTTTSSSSNRNIRPKFFQLFSLAQDAIRPFHSIRRNTSLRHVPPPRPWTRARHDPHTADVFDSVSAFWPSSAMS